jgi:hypothetical protein
MTDLAIDTHRFVKQLMESGFTESQAETLADAQMAFLESRLATKDELQAVRTELKADIAMLRSDMNTEFAAVRSEMNSIRAEMSVMGARFSSMLIRSQIATGAAIISILTFIHYITR